MTKYQEYFVATLITLCIVACEKSSGVSEQTCNGFVPPDTASALIMHAATGDSIIIDAAFWKIDTTGPLNYSYGSFKEIQETEKFAEINRFMAALIGGAAGREFLSAGNYSFTLFLDGSIQQAHNFDRQNILGYSIYSVHNHVLHHKLFAENKGHFTEINELSMQVSGVNIGAFRALAKKFFQPRSKSIIAFQLGITDSSKAYYFKFDRTGSDLAEYLSE